MWRLEDKLWEFSCDRAQVICCGSIIFTHGTVPPVRLWVLEDAMHTLLSANTSNLFSHSDLSSLLFILTVPHGFSLACSLLGILGPAGCNSEAAPNKDPILLLTL